MFIPFIGQSQTVDKDTVANNTPVILKERKFDAVYGSLATYAGVGGVGMGVDINVVRKNHIYSLVSYVQESFVFSDPSGNHFQVAPMIGSYIKNKKGSGGLYYQAGVSPVWGDIYRSSSPAGDGESKEFFTTGFVGRIGYRHINAQTYGFSTDISANINSEFPILSFSMKLDIGRLTKHRLHTKVPFVW